MAGSDIHRLARPPYPKSSKNTWKCLDPACEICFQSLRYKFHTSFWKCRTLMSSFPSKKNQTPQKSPKAGPYPYGRILPATALYLNGLWASPWLPGPELFRTMVQSSTRPGSKQRQRGRVCQQWSWRWIQLLGA